MADRTYRRPISYSELDWRQLQDLGGRQFAMSEFHGIKEDANFATSDQNSFEDAENVYIDDDAQLCQRPPLKESNNKFNDELVKIENIYGTIFYICKKDNDNYIKTFVNDTQFVIFDSKDFPIADDVRIFIWNDKYLVFSSYGIYAFSIVNNKLTEYNSESVIYIPVTERRKGNAIDRFEENKNIFTSKTATEYIIDSGTTVEYTDTSSIVGKEVIFEIDDVSYKTTWSLGKEKIFVSKKYSCDDYDYLVMSRTNNTYLGINYKDGNKNSFDSIYVRSINNNYFVKVDIPNNAKSYVYEFYILFTRNYSSRLCAVLSDDGKSVFLYTDSPKINELSHPLVFNIPNQQFVIYKYDITSEVWSEINIDYPHLLRSSLGTAVFLSNVVICPTKKGRLFTGTSYTSLINSMGSFDDAPDVIGYSSNENSFNFIVPVGIFKIMSGDFENPEVKRGNAIISYVDGVPSVSIYYHLDANDFIPAEECIFYKNTLYITQKNDTSSMYVSYIDPSGKSYAYVSQNADTCIPYNRLNSMGFKRGVCITGDENNQTSYGLYHGNFDIYDITLTKNITDNSFYWSISEKMQHGNRETSYPFSWERTRKDIRNNIESNSYAPYIAYENKIITSSVYYDHSTGDFYDLLFPALPLYINENGEFELYYNGNIYSNDRLEEITIKSVNDGEYNNIVPSNFIRFITYTLSVDNKIYQVQSTSESTEKLYVPEGSEVSLVDEATGFCKFSETALGVFTKNISYTYTYQEALSSELSVNAFSLSVTKFNYGNNKSTILQSPDGRFIYMSTYKGLIALSFEDFVQSQEQVSTYLTENISTKYREWTKNYKNIIKITYYKNWLLLSNGSNEILVYDLRNVSWWIWKIPFNIVDCYSNTTELYVFDGEKEYLFDFEDAISFTDYGINEIKWKIKSQKLHFGYIDNYKEVKELKLLSSNNKTGKLSIKTIFNTYNKDGVSEFQDTKLYDIINISHLVCRLAYRRLSLFQFEINNDVNLLQNSQLHLSSICIKYRIIERIR